MKSQALLFLTAVVLGTTAAQASSASSGMKNVVFSVCTPQERKCLELTSPVAQGTEWAPLYTFSHDSQVTLSKNDVVTESFIAQSSYLDLGNNQIVLTLHKGSKVIERSFSLDDLSEQKFITSLTK